ncbi:MAG TPA: hypothetical protein VH082_03810 [Rudaea sp.]|nr:hypothetical protein [Rudaea sp.]
MRKYAHWWVLLLFVAAFVYDAIVWGGAARLPDIGDKLQRTAQRQAIVGTVYMVCGAPLLSAVPALDAWGQDAFKTAVYEGFPRIHDDPSVAFDLIFNNNWNAHHRILRVMYWMPPILFVAWLIFWIRRPKKVRLMGRR